ncbi:DUF1501 domain-containing protein [Photobacterium sanguinicancri]|uniref:DUF1501 domain-containing protein n=1 Tax=Photobacterium sanguinicancri TaxID=875932 RepID=UPI0021C365C2|nr:DUF1501 domain-containing protein [Photobacterium sanguinicancri]
MKLNRRNFLKSSLAVGASSLVTSTAVKAATAGSTDYKALVCIFLKGGNDAYNMVVPRSPSAYHQYESFRHNIAINKDSLIDIDITTSNGIKLGLHPSMSAMKPIFEKNNATIIVNSGTLVESLIDRENGWEDAIFPEFLRAHNKQQSMWQIGTLNQGTSLGWAGRMMDYMSLRGKVSPAISISGNCNFLRSKSLQPLALSTSEPGNYKGIDELQRYNGLIWNWEREYSNLYERNYALMMKQRFVQSELLKEELNNFPSGEGYSGSLGSQLSMVGRMIRAKSAFSHSRQVFFVSLGGFDTHQKQLKQHSKLLEQVAKAMAAFQKEMELTNNSDNVTVFTMSDFGRRLQSNGDGTDHGWAGHQIVMGGAVNGGKAYGKWPDFSSDREYHNGDIIPGIAADQVHATLASWFGYPSDDDYLVKLFPSLDNFEDKVISGLLS